MFGQFFRHFMLETTKGDAIEEAAYNTGKILDAFLVPEANIVCREKLKVRSFIIRGNDK
ncbi:hypothetical protein PSYAC_19120 [Pseudomonas syringae pv. actinidiae str. M302091]|nr:hypothetical protein PSYAC_19120 [Pseudomonas syringae pv. actinidiae str. M302091]